MTTHELIARYSIARRELTGSCAGVVVHLCRAPGGVHFGGVTDGDTAWVVKLKPIQVNGFMSQTARAIYDAVNAEQKDASQRAA